MAQDHQDPRLAAETERTVNPAALAECARAAEQGQPAAAARALLRQCGDSDAPALEALMRLSTLADRDVERFHRDHEWCYCIRVPGLGDFWLAPLECWADLPAGAAVMSPRGMKALGTALAKEMVV